MSKSTGDEPRSVKDVLLGILTLHRQAALRAEGATTGTGPKVSGSKPGSADLHFGGELPLTDQMERSLDRWIGVWRAQVEQGSTIAKGDRNSSAAKARSKAILGERGMDPTAVAFIYGVSERAVQQARGRNGLDPETGFPKRTRYQERVDGKPTVRPPLTAPPGAVLAGLEALAGETAEQ